MRLPLPFRRPHNPCVYLAWWIPYVAVYQLTNRFPIREPRELTYGTLDESIAFEPALMPVYLLYFPLYWWTAIRSESDQAAARLFYAAYFQLAICAMIFILFPVRMPEAIIAETASNGLAGSFWRWFDGPNNCFPSLHAANGLLLIHFNWRRPLRWFHTAVGLGVVLSTVFVKQHYAVDVAAGAAVYLISVGFLSRLQVYEREPLETAMRENRNLFGIFCRDRLTSRTGSGRSSAAGRTANPNQTINQAALARV